jgi:isoleucyl-tRNA synthetase
MAPILSFTAEEAWKILRPNDSTIFVHTWAEVHSRRARRGSARARWDRILEVRSLVQKELEAVRQAGGIGSSLQAEVDIVADREHTRALASLGDDLRFVLITSAASVRRGDALTIAVGSSHAPKCERCWHWRSDVGNDPRIRRCAAVRGEPVRRRRSALARMSARMAAKRGGAEIPR